jgi:hypothetical protein
MERTDHHNTDKTLHLLVKTMSDTNDENSAKQVNMEEMRGKTYTLKK